MPLTGNNRVQLPWLDFIIGKEDESLFFINCANTGLEACAYWIQCVLHQAQAYNYFGDNIQSMVKADSQLRNCNSTELIEV